MPRWAIILNGQMLFVTSDEDTVKRFMAMGFSVFDHDIGYYISTDPRKTDARDLLTEADYLDFYE